MVSKKTSAVPGFLSDIHHLNFGQLGLPDARMLADNRGFAEFLFENTELFKIYYRNHIKIFVLPLDYSPFEYQQR